MAARFTRDSLLGALSGLSITLAAFLSGVLVARILGAEGAGTVAYYVWLALFLWPFVDLGAAAVVGRYVPELLGQGDPAVARQLTAYWLRILLAGLAVFVALGVALSATSGALPGSTFLDATGVSLLLLVMGYTAVQALASFAYAQLRGQGAFGTVARYGLLSSLFQIGSVTAGALLLGATGALIGYAVGQLLPALHALRLARGDGTLSPDLASRTNRYARYAWAANIASAFVWSRIEIFFLDQNWGATQVGLFAAALALSNLAVQGPLMLTTAVLPFLSRQRGRNDLGEMQRAYAAGTRLIALLAFPCCFGLAAIMPVVLPLVFGPGFAAAVPAATLLVCAAALSGASAVGTNLVLALDRNDFVFFSSLLGAGLAIVAGLTLVPAFGIMGAAAARASIQVFLIVFGMAFIARRLRCPAPLADLLRLLVAAAFCGACARLCIVLISGPAGLLPAIVAGALAYGIALRILRAIPLEDLALIERAATGFPAPIDGLVARVARLVGGSSHRPRSLP